MIYFGIYSHNVDRSALCCFLPFILSPLPSFCRIAAMWFCNLFRKKWKGILLPCQWFWNCFHWEVFGFLRRNTFWVGPNIDLKCKVRHRSQHKSDCVAHIKRSQIHTRQMATQRLLSMTDCSNSKRVKELFLHTWLGAVKLNHWHWNGWTKELPACLSEALVDIHTILSPR